MKFTEIITARLISQQLVDPHYKKVKDLVAWMGAIQAQDYNMAKWAIGIRLPGSTEKMVEKAIEKGEIIRTHVLRPTWHFIASEDVYWLLELTGPHIQTKLKTRQKHLELTEKIIRKSHKLFEKALEGGEHLTREELMYILTKAKIIISDNRSSHLLVSAELEGIICNGAPRAKKQTYALLEKRVPRLIQLNREEALAKLAGKYFQSHGPATVQDFIWWSGLPAGDGKKALEMIKASLMAETIKKQTYWFPSSFSFRLKDKQPIYLLPAYDEFIVSYRDRTAIFEPEHHNKSISKNGIFYPVILKKGLATGTWRPVREKGSLTVEVEFFNPKNKISLGGLEKASRVLKSFY